MGSFRTIFVFGSDAHVDFCCVPSVLLVVPVVCLCCCVVVVPREATELRDLQGKQQEEQSKATQEVQQRQGKLGFFRSLSVFDGKCLSL